MKRLAVILAMMLMINIAYSQKLSFQSAVSSFNKGMLDKAKNFIDPCTTDPDTKTWAKTWVYRGDIYLAIYLSKDDKYNKLDSNALNVAYNSFQKAIELDTKKEYWDNSDKLELNLQYQLMRVGEQYYNKGVKLFSAQKYNLAMENFDKTATINGESDTSATFNAAICADYAGKPDKAIEYYKKLIKANYSKPIVYSSLAGLYRNKYLDENPYKKIDVGSDTNEIVKLMGRPIKISKVTISKVLYDEWVYKNKLYLFLEYGKVSNYNTDSIVANNKYFDEGIKIVQKGIAAFPNENSIVISEVNLYLTAGKFDEAKSVLEKLKEKDPSNPSIYFAIGNAYFDQYNNESNKLDVRINAYQEAIKSLQKTIELKSDHFDAIYMLGAIYFNEGIRVEKESEKLINDLTLYNKEKEKFDLLYKQATENLEKANQLKPDDYNTLLALKKLYSKLNMTDKYKAINEKIKSLK